MAQRYVWMGVLATVGLSLLGAELGSPAAALSCLTAADCGGPPATCELTTYQTCAGKDPACPAGSPCGEKPSTPDQTGCAPYVEGICRQAYDLPCQVDADCGTGFHCAEQIGMSCSGSASSGGSGVAPESHEACHVSRGTFACELTKTACKLDSDCAAGLRCQPSDMNFCFHTTCDVDPACAAGLRCQQSGASFCWTSYAPSSEPDAVRALDTCTESPPVLCAPLGYFGVQELNLPDGGVAGSADDSVAGAGGSAPNAPPSLSSEQGGAADAGDRSAPAAPAGGDGCSLRAGGLGGRSELGWVALLGALIFRRQRRAAGSLARLCEPMS